MECVLEYQKYNWVTLKAQVLTMIILILISVHNEIGKFYFSLEMQLYLLA